MRSNFSITALVFFLCLAFASFHAIESKPDPFKLIVFEGSDWCKNCIRFERTVLSKEAFQTFAANHEIVVERIDFPQRNEQDADTRKYNAEIAERYDFKGLFPTVLLVNTETDEFVELKYTTEDAGEFISQLKDHLP